MIIKRVACTIPRYAAMFIAAVRAQLVDKVLPARECHFREIPSIARHRPDDSFRRLNNIFLVLVLFWPISVTVIEEGIVSALRSSSRKYVGMVRATLTAMMYS